MPLPKYTTISKNGVTYVDGTDRAQYCITELSRAAMRDVGKFIASRTKKTFYSIFKKITGKAARDIQYWLPKKDENGDAIRVAKLYVGFKRGAVDGFYAAFQETGTKHQRARHMLYDTVNQNIDEIQRIERQYLSGIDAPDDGASLIDENEMNGGSDG